MRKASKLLSTFSGFLALLFVLLNPLHGQAGETARAGGKTVVQLNESTWIGNEYLKRGRYEVQHVSVGETHYIIFKEMKKPTRTGSNKPGAAIGLQFPGKEIARVYCRVVPLGKTAEKVLLRRCANESGELRLQEIQFKGENVRHILPPSIDS